MNLCGTCKYFTDKQGPGKIGTCRAVPPTIILAGLKTITRYPEITPDMRACGLHKKDKRMICVENSAGYSEERERQWKGRQEI